MKAARLVEFGDPPAFALTQLPEPVPGGDEVVVALKAASLNRRDPWIWRQPGYCSLPVTLGSDGAGIIEAVGTDVTTRHAGDSVVVYPVFGWPDDARVPEPTWDTLGAPTDGTFAEKVVVPAQNVFPKPERLDWHEAATLGVAGLTAWRAVIATAGITTEAAVLITGAGSGVSTFAIQIAAAHGAAVYVTSSSPEKIDRAKALGARGGFSYLTQAWADEALAASVDRAGFDAVIDGYGDGVWRAAMPILRDGGVLVTYGDTGPPEATVEVSDVYWHWRSILGTSMGRSSDFRALLEHVSAAAWRPVIDSVFPLEDIAAAGARLESRERFGKVVLDLSA
jgi:zinc-binding alcohol dehydrogenase/oxidoreductase